MQTGQDLLLIGNQHPVTAHLFGETWLLGGAKNKMLWPGAVPRLSIGQWPKVFVRFYGLKGF